VFSDRLINNDDRGWFNGMLSERVGKFFEGLDFGRDVCGHGGKAGEEKRALLFGNYMEPGAPTPVYQHVADFVKLNSNMNGGDDIPFD
jgi:hypothetical protein